MSLGFEKVYLMQNRVNMQFSEIISTFVYEAWSYQFPVFICDGSRIVQFLYVIWF